MDRFRITEAAFKKGLNFLEKGTGKPPIWCTRFKEDLSVKGGKIYYAKREIIPKERVNSVLRFEFYKKNGDCPSARDSAFHILKKRYVGLSRRDVMKFIRAQKSLGEVKSALPKPKMSAGKKYKNYCYETDLVFKQSYHSNYSLITVSNATLICSSGTPE